MAMRPTFAITRVLIAAVLTASLLLFTLPSFGATAKTLPFQFKNIDGRTVKLADHRGQWVLVSFWAPWCPLCKVQMPTLKELDNRPDLTVIGIGLDYDNAEALRATVEEHNLGFTIIAGGHRRSPSSPHHQVGPVDFFPTSYLYDPEGEIAMYIPGQVRSRKVLAFMDNWHGTLAAKATPPAQDGRFAKLASFMKQQYGAQASKIYAEWQALLDGYTKASDPDKLKAVNDFFNKRIRMSKDQRIWGRKEYWSTLGELLGKGAGDSEDFAIAKYFTLMAMGTPIDRMRLFYVRLNSDARAGEDPVHMVLAVFKPGNRDPMLLDNRTNEVQPASSRKDLRPVYSFNSEGTWGDSQGAASGTADSGLPMWEDTLRRARNEGFE